MSELPDSVEGEEPRREDEIDALVIDRLAAYGHESVDESAKSGVDAVEASTGSDPTGLTPASQASMGSDTAGDRLAPYEREPVAEHEESRADTVEATKRSDAAGVAPTSVQADVVEAASSEDESDAGTITANPVERVKRRRRGFRGRSEPAPAQSHAKQHKDKRTKKLVGLKIGASQIAAAQVVNNGAPELIEVVREPLEPGLVVFGEIRDPDSLADALKRFFDLHKLPRRGIRLGISNNRVGVRIFEIEGVADPAQLENAIRFRAEEVLPIPLDEAILDYAVLAEETREDGTPWKRILLVVAYREVVDRYLQACRGAGLQVVGIDLEAFALLRSLEAPAERDPSLGALVAVAIGHDRTTIAVSNGVVCEFARVLDWGGWSLNVAIARELDRAPSEVELVKRQLSFARATEVEGLDAAQAAKARDAAQRALAAFAHELVSSLHFYQAQPGALGIGEIALAGGTAHMDGLPEAVGRLAGVPVRVGDPLKRVRVGPNAVREDQVGSMAVAIGLGIED